MKIESQTLHKDYTEEYKEQKKRIPKNNVVEINMHRQYIKLVS